MDAEGVTELASVLELEVYVSGCQSGSALVRGEFEYLNPRKESCEEETHRLQVLFDDEFCVKPLDMIFCQI